MFNSKLETEIGTYQWQYNSLVIYIYMVWIELEQVPTEWGKDDKIETRWMNANLDHQIKNHL